MNYHRLENTTDLAITLLLSSVATWLLAATLLSLFGMSWNGSLLSSSWLCCFHMVLLPTIAIWIEKAAITRVAIMAHIIVVTIIAPIGAIEVETNMQT